MFAFTCKTCVSFIIFFSAIKLKPKEGETYFDVVAVVDPVTRDAQRLAPLLMVCVNALLVCLNQQLNLSTF